MFSKVHLNPVPSPAAEDSTNTPGYSSKSTEKFEPKVDVENTKITGEDW